MDKEVNEFLYKYEAFDLNNNRIFDSNKIDEIIKINIIEHGNSLINSSSFQNKFKIKYFFSKFINLESLSIFNHKIENLNNLGFCKNLKFINFSDKYLKHDDKDIIDLNELPILPNLENLIISKIEIKDMSFLEKFTSLKRIVLNNNKLKKIEGLSNLLHLEKLNINNNNIKNIDGLKNCKNLKYLSLSENQISKIEGLDNCINLIEIDIDINQIIKIEGLDNCKNLTYINLYDNNIKMIEGLDNLHNLEILDLSRNSPDFSKYKDFSKFKNFKNFHIDEWNENEEKYFKDENEYSLDELKRIYFNYYNNRKKEIVKKLNIRSENKERKKMKNNGININDEISFF